MDCCCVAFDALGLFDQLFGRLRHTGLLQARCGEPLRLRRCAAIAAPREDAADADHDQKQAAAATMIGCWLMRQV